MSDITKKEFEDFLSSLFKPNAKGDKTLEHFFNPDMSKYTPVEGGIKDKVKKGYLYQIGGEPGMIAVTGYEGARRYIDSCRASGLPDDIIADCISVTDSEGIMTNTVWHKLSQVEWKVNPKD